MTRKGREVKVESLRSEGRSGGDESRDISVASSKKTTSRPADKLMRADVRGHARAPACVQ
jgi:hypothetical protein